MVDIPKQVTYWLQGAEEDRAVAGELVAAGRVRHSLYFTHLAVEKALKALVCRKTQDLAPRIHNLVRLVELVGLVPNAQQLDVLAELNAFQLEGRYPVPLAPLPSPEEAQTYLAKADEVLQWLKNQL